MTIDNINSDLITLENLSIQISDLINENNFKKILELDTLRQTIIQNIQLNFINDSKVKDKVNSFIKENQLMISISEKKLKDLNSKHNKFNKRFQAYFNSK